MKASRATLSSFAVLVAAGCATMQVRTDYNADVSFSQLKTYTWIDQNADANADAGGDPAINSPLLEKRIRSAVDSALASRGYQKVTSDTADFRVASRVVAEQRSRSDYGYRGSYYPYFGYGHFGYSGFGHRYFGRGYRGSFGYSSYNGSGFVREYLQATLILDIVDARTDELIWRGWARDDVDDNPSPERIQRYANDAVEKILENFPPIRSESGRRLIAS